MSISAPLDRFLRSLGEDKTKIRVPGINEASPLNREGHFHYYPELFLQCSGASRFLFPHQELVVAAGEILIVPAYYPHVERIVPTEEEFMNIVVAKNREKIAVHRSGDFHTGKPGIREAMVLDAEFLELSKLLNDFIKNSRNRDALQSKVNFSRLIIALYNILRGLEKTPSDSDFDNRRIEKCIYLIQCQISDSDLTVKALADQLSLNPDYLSHLFSQSVGMPIKTFINEQRVRIARYLLDESDLNSAEIAWACGYKTPGYFNRIFKRTYGVSPLEIRS